MADDVVGRITSLAWQRGGGTLASYTYQLGSAGHRLSMTEASGRSVAYGYDAAHRLTGETVAHDPIAWHNGAVGYTLDAAGNRVQRTSTLAPIPATSYAYNANDQLAGDGYDVNGNTTSLDGATLSYDHANRLVKMNGGAVTLIYDGDLADAEVGGTAELACRWSL
jgi:YD repeat-containing protein